jgi:hypothetical protein
MVTQIRANRLGAEPILTCAPCCVCRHQLGVCYRPTQHPRGEETGAGVHERHLRWAWNLLKLTPSIGVGHTIYQQLHGAICRSQMASGCAPVLEYLAASPGSCISQGHA